MNMKGRAGSLVVLFWLRGDEFNLGKSKPAEHVEDIHDALILGEVVAADDNGDLLAGGLIFRRRKFGFEFCRTDWNRIQSRLALTVHCDGLQVGLIHFPGRRTGFGQVGITDFSKFMPHVGRRRH